MADNNNDANENLIVVGIGASAGGLESLKEFFSAMPSDNGRAFVVIQHLDPARESYTPEILAKITDMKVVAATDGATVEADSVYTIPPNKYLRIQNGRLALSEMEKRDGMRMPIDVFFRSLAEDQRDRAICVILSGSGSDGTLGLREVRAAGGLTMVQQPETAQFDAMLRSAIATGMVDRVLPLREIAEVVQRYLPEFRVSGTYNEREKLDVLDAILDALTMRTGTDFSAYKKGTLLRRIERRTSINHLGSLVDYLRFLQGNSQEIDELSKDMLIGVSSFFRDADAFEELRRSVVAPLVHERPDHSTLRIWIPGCSTGEEAYSIAILFLEELAAANRTCPLQIFASDVDPEALKYAREGSYPHSIAADVSETRLHRFFTKHDSTYQVSKRLRESVIFSLQNLLTDAPFSRLDLISCRNVLIYIEAVVQRRLVSLFAFSLNAGGYLFLGKSDGIASQSPYFVATSSKWRIYRRSSATPPGLPEIAHARGGRIWGLDPLPKTVTGNFAHHLEWNQEALLKHFNAAVLLTDEHGTILHFFGPTGKYVEHPTGDASLNLLGMVGTRSAAKLRMALRKVVNENEPTRLERTDLNRGDSTVLANITIHPVTVRPKGDRVYAVIFEEATDQAAALPRADSQSTNDDALVTQLEGELKSLKSEFQATINDYETSAEELKAANEEILSINEELQSTNEELETSKEEIQSVNEELNTVNSELGAKIDELTGVNNDLVNFVNSSAVATIFLDKDCRIKRFTPAATNVMNLISSDLGRPIEDMAHPFAGLNLAAQAKQVLNDLVPLGTEVRSASGRWYTMRCMPYRTSDNRIDGVSITFIDVTELKQSEISIQEERNFAEGIIETMSESLLVLDQYFAVVSANRAFYQTFQLKPEDMQGRSIFQLSQGKWDVPGLRQLLESLADKDTSFNELVVEQEFPEIGWRSLLVNVRLIDRDSSSERKLILVAIHDVTARSRMRELVENEEQLRRHSRALEEQLIASGRLVSLGEITASMAHEFNNPLGIVMGFVEDLRSEIDPTNPQYQALTIIDEETKRCQKIINDLMQFARPGDAQRRPTYISSVIDTTLHMMESRLFKQKVKMAREVQPDLPPIEADPQQLEQVLVNLYLNALDVMPDGGTLTVGAALQAASEQQIVITVADTGPGITDNDMAKLFQPFYTHGKKSGLGLGLPICERIVKNHGGHIEVESQIGKGTTFRIYLPLTPPADLNATEKPPR